MKRRKEKRKKKSEESTSGVDEEKKRIRVRWRELRPSAREKKEKENGR